MKIFSFKQQKALQKTKKPLVYKWLFWTIFTWIFVRTFLFQGYTVPSDSMEKTYMRGDRIVVNKLIYGARFPITPLAIPFTNRYLEWLEIPYFRFPSIGEIRRKDILVFNFPLDINLPIDRRKEYVKRCAGLPGDYIIIRNGAVTASQIKPAKKLELGAFDPSIFPHSSSIKWNRETLGPLFVPKKGTKIKLNDHNYSVYKKLIEDHEKVKIARLGNDFYVGGEISTSYEFQADYFFVLGDNANESYDSRYWGFVPKSHIIGKAIYTY